MSDDTTNSTLAGAGSGAASGAAAGSAFGPWGTLVGGVVGGVAGGISGNLQGRAASKRRDAEEEARRRYLAAVGDYGTGTQQSILSEQGDVAGLQQKSQQAGMNALVDPAEAAAKVEALKATTPGAPSGTRQENYYALRSQAATSQQDHAAKLANVQAIAEQAQTTHGMDQRKLNYQLAQVANTHGVERAQMAAKFAAATGQYPLDMMMAENAGMKEASQAAMIEMGKGIVGGAAKGYAANREAQAEHRKTQDTLDAIRAMRSRPSTTSTDDGTV